MTRIYKMLIVKLGGQNPLGRIMHRWEDNIEINLGSSRSGEGCIMLSMVMNLWVP
jgi:hypothetical protein